ncbi:MAG: DUF763 domain-containing protein [Deltaproteobacteria bacterium]|nr:DUF763 domain-containing protein [Deltaproteobacteria bacterium]
MVNRSGTANLPLHYGKVPAWLHQRMALLGSAICEAVVVNEGRSGFLSRLSDPFWFQSFGAVLGMDWHSSGITTSVMGALKNGLRHRQDELGIYVCGGRGKHSRKTPEELDGLANRIGLDGDSLIRASKLTAKVDNVAVQDGYSLYLHSFVVTRDGQWVVVQQGMNDMSRQARRYHWRSAGIQSFVDDPHDAIVGPNQGCIVNLTDRRSRQARDASVDMLNESPGAITAELKQILAARHLQMPEHHEVRPTDVFLKRLHGVLALARSSETTQFEDLLLTKGLGPRSMQALALVAEVVYGAPSRFDDPARFAFAHGGKDGHPCPVPLHVYDATIQHLKDALNKTKVGHTDKLQAFNRLDSQIRHLEKIATGPDFEAIVENEWRQSSRYGGMTVIGKTSDAVEQKIRGKNAFSSKQLSLFGRGG